jgi:hypothetical protein
VQKHARERQWAQGSKGICGITAPRAKTPAGAAM